MSARRVPFDHHAGGSEQWKPATSQELFNLRAWWQHFRPRLPLLLPQIYEAADAGNRICVWRGPLTPEAAPTDEGIRQMQLAKSLERWAWSLWFYARRLAYLDRLEKYVVTT